MNSLEQLERSLAFRRKRRQMNSAVNPLEPVNINEIRNTNLEFGLFSGSARRPDISEHYKDIEYTKRWYSIYQAVRERKLIPGRNMLKYLKNFGENRVDELEEQLQMALLYEYDPNEEVRAIYGPKIDLINWKLRYYGQTIKDAQEMLEMHDDQTMYLDVPMGPDSWWILR
ncbi:hypothetical protein TWF730_001684 [Orbilia blumenaviensis]|uniref:Uncharacterized protein n=1 Tax=Orbilia blumenaviensis TaxID=1796055 RepID=A0AAV9UM40_9PEZI